MNANNSASNANRYKGGSALIREDNSQKETNNKHPNLRPGVANM